MNKKLLPLLVLMSSPALSFAQSTLNAANFNPVTTDAFALKICNNPGISPGASGASATWNFASTLTPMSSDTGKVASCPSSDMTTHCALFPGSNIILKGPGLNYNTAYYNDNSSTVSIKGYYSAPDTNIILSDMADQFRYPFTYGTTFTDTYAGIISIGALSGHVNGSVNVNCDGWGTLNLPGRTETNVLRVHTTQTFIDSVQLLSSTPIVISYTLETYSWYKPSYHSALLTIATATQTGAPTPFNTFVAYSPAQVSEVPDMPGNFASLSVYPNPVHDQLSIDYSTTSTIPVRIALSDITGREIATLSDKTTSGNQHISYNTAALPKGLYFARIQAGEETTTRKVEIQ